MATIFDFKEPNGLGMFSQAGRVTSAKYAIFRKRDEIFSNQKRVIKVTALPALAIDISKKENQPKRIKEEVEERPTLTPEPPKKPTIPPFSRQLSREEVNKVKERKTTTPTHGLYTPKFTFVERCTAVLVNYNKEKARPMSSSVARPVLVNEEELTRPIVDKPKSKVLGSISFKTQTSRGHFFKRAESQSEQKLTEQQLATPPLIRTRTVGSYRINRDSSRRSTGSFSVNRALTFASPKAQTGSSGPSFNQLSGKRILRKSSEIPLRLDNYSPQNADKRVEGENTTRDLTQINGDFKDVLFFTQKRVSSRLSMREPSDKISEINKCSEENSEEEL